MASAHTLGIDSASIARIATKQRIVEILDNNLKLDEPTKLVIDMCVKNNYDKSFELLNAFSNGFKGR